jgi:NAD(P)-dependent dehydrogenase (short-subunit alcohol dehydrogenase family)
MLLEKKVALVTGASRGIGRGIALEMAREGADVIVYYNNSKEKANEVARSIEAVGRRSLVVKADISNQKSYKMKRLTHGFEPGWVQIPASQNSNEFKTARVRRRFKFQWVEVYPTRLRLNKSDPPTESKMAVPITRSADGYSGTGYCDMGNIASPTEFQDPP